MSAGRLLLMLLVVLTFVLPLAGCTTPGGANTGYLLEQDFRRMTNPQLTAYEQELSEVIASSADRSSPGISLGVGVGSWGEHSGVGLGVEKWLGGAGGGDAAVELRARREAVRTEMRQRGLLPASPD